MEVGSGVRLIVCYRFQSLLQHGVNASSSTLLESIRRIVQGSIKDESVFNGLLNEFLLHVHAAGYSFLDD